MPFYTPTEKRLLAILNDGERHTRDELKTCLRDELASAHDLSQSMWLLRKKLNPQGLDIVFEIRRGWWYRQVRMLHSPYRE